MKPERRYPMRMTKFRKGWMNMEPNLPVPNIDWIKSKILDIAYGPDPLQKLDVYYPNIDKEKYPVIIVIHGGGWSHMDKRDWHLYPSFFGLEKGFMVASVNYRLIPKHKSPSGINDCFGALEYLVNHADNLKIDLSNVFIWGASAGGNLGTITALKYSKDTRLNIKAMIAVVPALDMKSLYGSLYDVLGNKKPKWLFKLLRPYILKKLSKNHFEYVLDFEKTPIGPYDASYYLSDKAPKFYFQYGGKDTTIPPKTIEDFARKLLQHGLSENEIIFDLIEDAPHMGASYHFFDEEVILRYINYCAGLL